MKVINKTELKDTDYMMRNLHREADVLRRIRHENIVQLYEVPVMRSKLPGLNHCAVPF